MDRGAWWATVHGVTELDTTEQLSMCICIYKRPLDKGVGAVEKRKGQCGNSGLVVVEQAPSLGLKG